MAPSQPAPGRATHPQIVVVAYGDPGPLVTCLASLDATMAPIVVDNSSNRATRALVEQHGGTYLDPGSNLGFAGGVNHGLALTDPGRDVLLLNPDAAIGSAAILELQRLLHAEDRVACVAPSQVDPTNGAPARVTWPRPSPLGAWAEAIGWGDRRRGASFVIGSVLLLNGEAIREVGRLDERFFLYAEETDWQMRALDLGWRVTECPSVMATHLGAGTGGDPTRRETHFHASHERLIRKHFGTGGWIVYRAGTIVGTAIRALVPPQERRARARLRLRLYLAGPCRVERQLGPSPAAGPAAP